MQDSSRARRWTLGFAAALLALGAYLVYGTLSFPDPPAYTQVGPRLFPGLIAGGLCLAGLGVLATALRPRRGAGGGAPGSAEGDGGDGGDGIPDLDWKPVLVASAGLVLHFLLVETIGFVLASTLLFVAMAFAFGSRRVGRDALVGLALALLAYVGFTRGLGLALPTGFLPF
jgi:putative tricarboxylic transport membrane protein